ncbi:MAG: DUF6069 family protein [Longimicrobiaceae bacterium]
MNATTTMRRRMPAQVQARGSLWRVGLLAALLSAAMNAAIFTLAVALGIFPSLWIDPQAGAQMAIEPVILVSAVGAMAGVSVFALLRRRTEQPLRVFLWLAGAVLLVSFAAPFALPMSGAQILVLELLHLVVAAVVVGALLRWAAIRGYRSYRRERR